MAIHESTVEVGHPAAFATALVPPSAEMISETGISRIALPKFGNERNSAFSVCVIYPRVSSGQLTAMLTTAELLARLEERGIRNIDIAKALGVTPSRVTEMKKGERAIKLDEAATLVSEFDLQSGSSQRVSPLPAPIARLIVEHVVLSLGESLKARQSQIDALAEDVRAFAEFVTDPKARESIELAMAFFQAVRLRHPAPGEATPSETNSLTAK